MKRRFIAKRKWKYKIFKIIFLIGIIYLSFIGFYNYLIKNKIKIDDTILKNQNTLLNIGLNISEIPTFEPLEPRNILNYTLNYFLETDEPNNNITDLHYINETLNDEKPLVYIYNTHDTEGYDSALLEAYNITFTVGTASYILSDYLKDLGIPCYVEKESMADYLKNNGLLYKNSYDASRHYIEKRLKEYPTIKYIIDIHRDSALASVTKIEKNGLTYAKMMFVVGMDHPNYNSNLEFAELINSKLLPELSRGISKKTGSKVNGIYNQDLNSNAILIEVGGVDNKIDEVNNTLKEFSKVFFESIKGE